ncbi:MAG TPA: low molecular weight protein arginine phosphatase [Syntrophothermus lipocalidus]|uniref:Protein tyrosine phosphatase n=1 Tax=Syntrophothermus lipocalidus (strain DSM 12680 / TGB-C1) TaxID=643648 RepID=D7CJT1_SYNLT|nr:low molecular weight protein arginine phosphatase [Syntrophothermus lipocalidus]ADI03036.1 protein tyrosine phosphatase [Syntrophothermus lipocalidus DSM 12680]HHV76272.1 low molecular weight protein arginine phosphatase [Syntrophothermus lipocalidus]HOV42315.1 low molecular weight protein arginine phosphatase [Syntrophothermus lipocalidus]
MRKVRVLFVCSGNTCRSPMAAALFRKYLEQEFPDYKDAFVVDSAGLYALDGSPATKEAIEIMALCEQTDLTEHRSKSVQQGLIEESDLILAMTAIHRDELIEKYPWAADKIFTLKEFALDENSTGADPDLDVMDPFGLGLDAYEEACTELKQLIEVALERLVELCEEQGG